MMAMKLLPTRNWELLPARSMFALVILLLRFVTTTCSVKGRLDTISNITVEDLYELPWRKRSRPWEERVQVVHGDVNESTILTTHCIEVHGVYFLIKFSNSLLVLKAEKFPHPG